MPASLTLALLHYAVHPRRSASTRLCPWLPMEWNILEILMRLLGIIGLINYKKQYKEHELQLAVTPTQ